MIRLLVIMVLSVSIGGAAMAYESIYPKTQAGKIEVKEIPERTALTTAGKGDPFEKRDDSFKILFDYIKENDVAMTVPVEGGATSNTLRFFVGGEDAPADLKAEAPVEIRQLDPVTVISAGVRGSYTRKNFEKGLEEIDQWLQAHPEWEADGEPYVVYWNSPFVPGFLKTSEVHQPVQPTGADSPLYDFAMKDIDGQDVGLKTYKGDVLLIVNVASRCGLTPQYTGLEALNRKYRDQGLVILGFPANNFMGQEPGTNLEIKAFCTENYGVTFPMFSKISVKGEDQHPLYRYLTSETTDPDFAGEITWNFNKFLVDRKGRIVNRFDSGVKPEDPQLVEAIEAALAQ